MSVARPAPPVGLGLVSGEAYATCYERLRARMQGRAPQGPESTVRGLALATVLEEGLPGWLHAIASALAAIPSVGGRTDAAEGPASHVSPQASSLGPLVPPARQQEVAMLLANLALSRMHPTHRSDRREPGGTRC